MPKIEENLMPHSKRPQKYLYITWLSGLMSSDVSCLFQTWFKTNYKLNDKVVSGDPEALARWQSEHTAFLTDEQERFNKAGFTTEKEFEIKAKAKQGILLAGKIDLLIKDEAKKELVKRVSQQKEDRANESG